MTTKITKREMMIDFATKSSKELEAKYHIDSKQVDEIRSLQGRKLEERISKMFANLGGDILGIKNP